MNEKTDIHENLITLPFFPVTLLIEKDETGYSIVKVTVVLKWLYLSIFTTFGQKNRFFSGLKRHFFQALLRPFKITVFYHISV